MSYVEISAAKVLELSVETVLQIMAKRAKLKKEEGPDYYTVLGFRFKVPKPLYRESEMYAWYSLATAERLARTATLVLSENQNATIKVSSKDLDMIL